MCLWGYFLCCHEAYFLYTAVTLPKCISFTLVLNFIFYVDNKSLFLPVSLVAMWKSLVAAQ